MPLAATRGGLSALARASWTLGICLAATAGPFARAIDLPLKPLQLIDRGWDARSGLPVSSTWSVAQDRNGFIWVGTEGGLARFDGATWKVWNTSNSEAFLVDDVRSVAAGPNGEVWAAVLGGGVVRVVDGIATRFDRSDGLISDAANTVFVAANGDVWVGLGDGACRLRAGQFVCFDASDGLVSGRILRIAEDARGVIWLGSFTHGLSAYANGQFQTFTTADGLATPQVFLLAAHSQQNMVVGTYKGDLHSATDGALAPLARGSLPTDIVPLSGAEDRAGQFWLGTNDQGGLWRLLPQAQRLDNPAAPVTSVFGVLADTEGALWAASSKGECQFRNGLFTPWGKPEGLANSTFVIAQDASGAMLIGSEGEGLFRLDAAGEVQNWTTADGLPLNSISALLAQPDGTVWVGTFGGGLALLRNSTIERVLTVDDGLGTNQVSALHVDRTGALWVATTGGLSRMVEGRVERTVTVADGLVSWRRGYATSLRITRAA